MIEIAIPGFGSYKFRHLALDCNGTLALDGTLLPGVAERLRELAELLPITVLTADTHGNAAALFADLPVTVQVVATVPGLPREDQAKRGAIIAMPRDVAYIGNGHNDAMALEVVALGIVVIGPEGASSIALEHGDLVMTDIRHALDLLLHPHRLVATLRR